MKNTNNNKMKIFVVLLVTTISFFAAKAQTITLVPVVTSGLTRPDFVTNAKDNSGRMFIVEQSGVITFRYPNGTTSFPFLDITTKVRSSGNEQGLLGLTFHPNFWQNGYFWVDYTRVTDGATVIARYKINAAGVGDVSSEKILLTIPQPFTNHNGGMVEIGPDGNLYVGMGDGGSANDPGSRAQNINEFLGKMLRVTPDITEPGTSPFYTSPTDNPYVGIAGLDEIYTIGMRNPWRYSFDRGGTRQLYAGDVGQGSIEEVDIIQRGKNYGWRAYEGTSCTGLDPAFCSGGANPILHEPPITQYSHSGGRCSITGGYVYRGRRGTFPQGTYIYADYCSKEIFTLIGSTSTLILTSTRNIVSFGEDEQGEIFVVGSPITGGVGSIDKIVNPSATTARNIVADFDGDLRSDISVFRPSSGVWYWSNSSRGANGSAAAFSAAQFGISTDLPAAGDFDGDGKTDVAVFRPSSGDWYVLNSSNSTFTVFHFGANGDIPVQGDYDGDGKSDFAVYRGGIWYVWQSSTSTLLGIQFGISTDKPVPADFNGDGRTDFAVWRPNNDPSQADFYILRSSDFGFTGASWGVVGDVPVIGDYDGDSKADIAVWRPSNGVWYVNQSSGSNLTKPFGLNGDEPAPADYDGDGKTDTAIIRDTAGTRNWYINRSTNSAITEVIPFGSTGDKAIPNNDVP